MNEKGQTLIELVIAIALFAMVIVGFIVGLNVGIMGTYRTSQSNVALNLARSQIEYTKLQDYQPCSDESCNVTYSKLNATVVESLYPGLSSDDIEITVANVSDVDGRALQQVTVTVTYENGTRYAQAIGYKSPRVGFSVGGPGGGEWGVVSSMVNLPTWMYGKEGYYYVFDTAGGPLCATWIFTDEGQGHGNLMTVFVMSGIPEELGDTGQGEGLVVLESAEPICNAAAICVQQQAAWQPETETYLVALEGAYLEPGTYTALFYNDASQDKRVKTSTASITYWW
jgi:type II secretory pathway pseudopilin PulG